MPAPPASSSTGRPRTQTPMSYEKFKPKFPIDPFVGAEQTSSSAREPWTLDVDNLPFPSILQHERRVVLVIGQPAAASLFPLFVSRQLSSSLLIIASHRPPALPFDTRPSVYTLRLRTPLAVADGGATRLIEILEWALQVARIWRRSGGPKKQELMEEVSPGTESVPLGQSFGRLRYSIVTDGSQDQMAASSAFYPEASVTSLAPHTAKRTRKLSLFRRQSSLPLIPDPASAKPFDALLHFLPADAPDKARLKAMILVTTLTRPYLAVPPTRARSTRFYSESSSKLSVTSSKSGKRWSFFRSSSNVTSPSNSSSTLSASKSTTDLTEGSRNRRGSLTNFALLRTRRSRVIHLMPSAPALIKTSGASVIPASSRHPSSNSNFPTQMPAQAHLIRNIEAFLLSFCFSISPDLPTPIAGFAANEADCGKARPYVLPVTALAETLQVQSNDDEIDVDGERRRSEWSLAELILSGALESEDEYRSSSGLRSGTNTERNSNEIEKGKERQLDGEGAAENDTMWMAHRAWIGSVREIVVTHGSSANKTEKTHTVAARSSSQPLLTSQSHSRTYPAQSQGPSQLQAQPRSGSQQLSYPKSVQPPSPSDRTRSTQIPTSAVPPRAALYIDTKRRRESKRRGYQSLAIEKRLPTPPEDENEDEELEEDYGLEAAAGDVDSTISNATSCTRSPYSDDDYAEKAMTPRASEWERDSFAYGRWHQYPSERVGSSDHARENRHQRYDSYPYSSSGGITSPSSGYPSTSSSSTPTPSTITHSNTPSYQHRSSSRHQYRFERTPSQRQAPDYDEEEDMYQENGKTHQHEEEYIVNGSLPTPPDSEKASFEGVIPDPVVISASVSSAAACSRGREREPAGMEASHVHDSLSRLEYTRSREEKRRESVQDAESYLMDRDRDRPRRQRAYSQPSRPPLSIPAATPTPTIPAPVSASTTDRYAPPRRSKTKPKEKERRVSKDFPPFPPRDAAASKSSSRSSKPVMEILNKPLRPDPKRNSANVNPPSSSSGERERRHAKLEKRPSKPEMKGKGNGSNSRRDRERERGQRGGANSGTSSATSAGSGPSAIKRVPVPALEDVLPAVPRPSASVPAPTSSRSAHHPQSRSQMNPLQGSSFRMTKSSSEVASEKERHHQHHNTKWKFWKGDTGAVMNA